MSNHTPGPWVVDSEDADLFTQNQARMWINAPGMHIGYVDGPRTSERIANARLIAAAPEMYELLANLAAVCDGWDEDYENDEQRANAFWHMARIAKVLLLTKIEGGESNG